MRRNSNSEAIQKLSHFNAVTEELFARGPRFNATLHKDGVFQGNIDGRIQRQENVETVSDY